jgi:hypothetical protein
VHSVYQSFLALTSDHGKANLLNAENNASIRLVAESGASQNSSHEPLLVDHIYGFIPTYYMRWCFALALLAVQQRGNSYLCADITLNPTAYPMPT